ncbi:hypothetical protein H634G_06495 [Metarhizium anisopliae BRIP 53293]|uniref:Uncharacterized protein n=1 Tax=Metarhizium anisopliae BRIP 53293 TaxID=1291518 RepID=A0A0D9NW68_METAN|nr:hypothetical protein H634G_06495 [Metarhizium anisopliae BRIP 53293]KJK90092.1 hypothetical protein H633G_06043 [Metarhizium anisopliae BRIP 53284]
MKASSVLLAVFSGLAIASPALSARQDLAKANEALNAFDAKNAEVKAYFEQKKQNNPEGKSEKWKKTAGEQVDLINKLKAQLNGSPQEVQDNINRLSEISQSSLDRANTKHPESSGAPGDQKSKPEQINDEYTKIASDLRAALN